MASLSRSSKVETLRCGLSPVGTAVALKRQVTSASEGDQAMGDSRDVLLALSITHRICRDTCAVLSVSYTRALGEYLALRGMWTNSPGPSRLLAKCATGLLIASALLAVEAGILMVLGPARGIVLKPFILAGYVEACAMIISLLGIVAAIIGLIFYRPYLYLSEKIYMYRARNAAQVSDAHTYFENVGFQPYSHNPDEDGAPD